MSNVIRSLVNKGFSRIEAIDFIAHHRNSTSQLMTKSLLTEAIRQERSRTWTNRISSMLQKNEASYTYVNPIR